MKNALKITAIIAVSASTSVFAYKIMSDIISQANVQSCDFNSIIRFITSIS